MESQTHTTTTSAFHFEVNLNYIKSIPGILKIIQIVLSIIAFGCSVGSSHSELGWVSFVSITGFIHAIFYLVLHLVLVIHSKWNVIIELIIYAVWTLFFLIGGIVAAAFSAKFSSGQAGAASAFSFFSMVVWGIDTALQARNVSITWTSSSTTTTATRTHTSTSNTATNSTPPKYDDNVQY